MSTPMKECSICLDDICHLSNCTTTECGHNFHTSCLMRNVSHNGFGCPNCRAVMAEQVDNDDDDDDDGWISSDEEEMFDDDALTSFRMFHQRLNNEEVEEEPEDEFWEDEDEDNDGEDQQATPANALPSVSYVTRMLMQKGINMEDLVKIMLQSHEEYEESQLGPDFELAEGRLYGKVRQIIVNYKPEHERDFTNVTEHNTTIAPVPPLLDSVADSKVTLRPHQRTKEFMSS